MNFIKLTKSPLSVDEISQIVGDASCGAISLFVGTTRDNFEGKSVHRLEYEAYDAMAEKEINKICQECRKEWNVNKIAIYHRLGVVNVKEASIVIAVSSEHRKESLAAVSYLIDNLKASVPIWKKEIYSDNESEWKQNKECSWIKKENLEEVQIKEEPISDDSDLEVTETKVFPDLNFPKRKLDENLHLSKRRKMDPTFVQITATQDEIERRIKAFQERKREELNILNIQQFCSNGIGEDDCARTAAIYVRPRDSSSHVKVTKVNNSWGPQTSIINSQFGSAIKSSTPSNIPDGVEERVVNLERHLHMKPGDVSSLSIFARLNAIEKKVLFLEGLSPEYFNIPNQRCPIATFEDLEDEDDISDLNKDSLSDSEEEDMEEYMDRVFGDGENVTDEQIQQEIDRLKLKIKKRNPHYVFASDG